MSAALLEKTAETGLESHRASMEAALHLVRDERILPRSSAMFATGELMGRMNRLYIKDETENPTGAFKLRGAWVRINQLNFEERARGIVTASAGNHAQGVALAASLLGVHADIFVPSSAPLCKKEQTRRLGGDMVTLHEIGEGSFDEALRAAEARCLELGTTFIHPYDDLQVIYGQGTIGTEIGEQLRSMSLPGHPGATEDSNRATVFVPVGGGGLAAGVGMSMKDKYPGCRVIGVQLEGADSAAQSWAAGRRVNIAAPNRMADGTAVRTVGSLGHELMQRYVDEFVVVSPVDLGRAYADELQRRYAADLFDGRLDTVADMPETSAMLARAGALKFAEQDERGDEPWVLVQTGRNIDWSKADQALEAYLATKVNTLSRSLGCGALRAAVPRN